MNSALDSPLEALLPSYLAYGFLTAVNNIWAWIAVVTAALSFWRMRAPSSSTQELMSHQHGAASAPPRVAEPTTTETPVSPAPAKPSCRVLEREGSVKLKFRVYYEEEEEEDGGESEESSGEAAGMRETWRDDWERMMLMRMGDMGWYRGQNRMVLDGSVVRLWEGRSPRHAAAQVVGGGGAW